MVGELPTEYQGRHYWPGLVCYVMYQHYQCRVTQPLIYEQLREWGIDISAGQVNRLLNEEHQRFEQEQHQVLRAGLETATYIHTDDTGARHNGKNGYCTVIGNDDFAYFHSSNSKSRENFLEILQAGAEKYVLNEEAKAYLENYQLPHKHLLEIGFSEEPLAITKEDWHNYLLGKGIVGVKTVRVLSEAALLGGLTIQGRSEPLRILSDGAGQFNIMEHGLCWVHIERNLRKLEGKTEQERENIADMQGLLWEYYQELKQYQQQPSRERALSLQDKFDEIFGRCYIHHGLLNHALNQIRNRKIELLQVLNCPEFPLHNNAAETDIREYVTRRKISGGTRSELGRKARDTFVGLKKTCRKLGISFWNYLTSRLCGDEQVRPLSDVLRAKAAAKIPAPA
nr:transposase [Chamaesiphon minutus]